MSDPGTPLSIEKNEFDYGISEYDLTVMLKTKGVRAEICYKYNLDLFPEDFIEQLSRHNNEILEQIVERPDLRVGDLQLVSNMPPRFLGSYDTQSKPVGETIDQRISAVAARRPNDTAVRDDGRSISFRELDSITSRWARFLHRQGIRAGEIVGIHLGRCVESIVATVAVLKAGCTYLPLDSAIPHRRLELIAGDCDLSCLVTHDDEALSSVLANRVVISPDTIRGEIVEVSNSTPVHGRTPDSPCCLIYTSGSTGVPKGVLLPHRAIINQCNWLWDRFPADDTELACLKTKNAFVDATWELFGPLMAGIPLRIVPEHLDADPRSMYRFIVENKITRITVVPALLDVLDFIAPEVSADNNKILWFVGGEKVTPELVRKFRDTFPGHRLVNLYGSSETGGISTFFEYGEADPQ